MDTTKRDKEIWDRLADESTRAYRAFEFYLALPPGERTLVAAYKAYTGNPEARVSDTYSGWSRQHFWIERATAYDDHMNKIRQKAYELGIEEEAKRQAQAVERTRHRLHELLTLAYDRACECLEDENWASSLRASDVISIARLHLEVTQKFGSAPEVGEEVSNWNEEDDQLFDKLLKEIEEEERKIQEGGDAERTDKNSNEEG